MKNPVWKYSKDDVRNTEAGKACREEIAKVLKASAIEARCKIVPDSGKDLPTGNVVGTTDTQGLTNKTIDVDNNTVTNIEDDNIKTGAAINAAKIAGHAIILLLFSTEANVESTTLT